MKLKRYVLLDNNRVVDRKTETNELIIRILERIECDDTENLCRQLVSTSDNALELAVKGDLIEDELGEIVMVKGNDKKRGCIMLSGFLVSVEYKYIYKLYKLIGKDYICVWEKGN